MSMLKKKYNITYRMIKEIPQRCLVVQNLMNISPLAVKWISVDSFARRYER